MDYKQSGVDIDAGNRAVQLIKPLVKSTNIKGVLGSIGLFGGCFAIDSKNVLVSATDGVGTKLKLAVQLNKHSTIGIDLVAMNVNDIVCQGARPLFFLDYIGCNKVKPKIIQQILAGIAKGCILSGSAIIGGEIAELGDLYKKGEYDLAGFAVGRVAKKDIIDGKKIRPGDKIIGLASSGLHSNGFSLARKVLRDKKHTRKMLTPTRIYVKSILKLIKQVQVNGIAHITGGGLFENIERLLKKGLTIQIDKTSWNVPEIFRLIQEKGRIKEKEMFRTFNMGIGMAVIVRDKDALKTMTILQSLGEKVYLIGRIEKQT